MKKETALTPEKLEQQLNAGKEKLIAKKNEAITAAEKKFSKRLKELEGKFKEKGEKQKKSTIEKVKINKKGIEQLHNEGKTIEEIANHFEAEIESIKAKMKSLGLVDKKKKK
jgi:predicted Rossmann fold nucleotide-binding protein DprA/Smf involved in DNA uptake